MALALKKTIVPVTFDGKVPIGFTGGHHCPRLNHSNPNYVGLACDIMMALEPDNPDMLLKLLSGAYNFDTANKIIDRIVDLLGSKYMSASQVTVLREICENNDQVARAQNLKKLRDRMKGDDRHLLDE